MPRGGGQWRKQTHSQPLPQPTEVLCTRQAAGPSKDTFRAGAPNQAQTGRERGSQLDIQDQAGPLCTMPASGHLRGQLPWQMETTETRCPGAGSLRVSGGSWVLPCCLNFLLRETARTWVSKVGAGLRFGTEGWAQAGHCPEGYWQRRDQVQSPERGWMVLQPFPLRNANPRLPKASCLNTTWKM